MEVKETVKLAVKYISDLFESEIISHVGLEEIEFDDTSQNWLITVGFNRQWANSPSELVNMLNSRFIEARRTYKIVKISDGKVISVKNRPIQAIA